MCKSIPGTQKHMTLDQRIMIEKGLDQGSSLRSIALQLGKDPTTISKEIKKHRSIQEHNHFNESKTNALWLKTARKRTSVVFMPQSAKGCVNSAITVIPIAMTSLPAAIIARN